MKITSLNLDYFITAFLVSTAIFAIILVLNGYTSATATIIWIINAAMLTILSYLQAARSRKLLLIIEQYKKTDAELKDYCNIAYKYNVDCVEDLQNMTEHSKKLLDFSIKRTPFEEIPPLFMAVDLQIQEIRNRYAKP